MKISWNSIRVSIAGARLSHLVQKDNIWDHGSMVEQVRMVAVLLKKTFHRGDAEIIKKCMSERIYEKIKKEIEQPESLGIYKTISNNELDTISIIDVVKGKNGREDKFTASLKFKRTPYAGEWVFVRHKHWWLLDQINTHKSYKNILFNN